MPEKKPIVLPPIDEAHITLESVEFDNDYQGDDERPHRTIFVFRLYTEENVYRKFPVTMCEPYEGLDDLRLKAWRELYITFAQFAELSRRECDAPQITFESS